MNPEDETDALSRESADRKGSTNRSTGGEYETVCTVQSRRPLNPFTREQSHNDVGYCTGWWMARLRPTKDVPSCDKLWGSERRRRTTDPEWVSSNNCIAQ